MAPASTQAPDIGLGAKGCAEEADDDNLGDESTSVDDEEPTDVGQDYGLEANTGELGNR